MREINQATETEPAGPGAADAPAAIAPPQPAPARPRRDSAFGPSTPAQAAKPAGTARGVAETESPARPATTPRLTRVRSPYRLTKLGAGTLVLIVLIAGAAVNTGTNLLYLMLSSLLSLWTITFAIYWLNFYRLKILRRLPGEIYADAPTEIRYELTNSRRRVTTFGISAMDPIAATEPPTLSPYFMAVAPRRTATVTMTARFKRRGWIELPDIVIVSSFPFGFLDARRKRRAGGRALVYPALIPLEGPARRHAIKHGQSESSRKGSGASLYAIRDYVWGDSARSIHWKLSSKGVGVKVREFESEDTRRYRIVLDEIPPAEPDAEALERFELGVSVAASLARIFIRDGFTTSLWTPGGVVGPGEGATQFRRIATLLALLEWRGCVGGRRTPPADPAGEVLDVPVSAFFAEAREIAARNGISG